MRHELVHPLVVDHVNVGPGHLVPDVVPAGGGVPAGNALRLIFVRLGDVVAAVVDHVNVGAGDLVADVVSAGMRVAFGNSLLRRLGICVALGVVEGHLGIGALVADVVSAGVRVFLGDLLLLLGVGLGLAVMASGVSGGRKAPFFCVGGYHLFNAASRPAARDAQGAQARNERERHVVSVGLSEGVSS